MRVLVAAASKYGSTSEIAEALGRTLSEHGVEAEVRRVEEVEELEGYDAVVLGSAVYVGQWLEAARTFVQEHAEALGARPTWLFSSGPLGEPLRPREDQAVQIGEILEATGARGHRLFAGKLDKSRLGFGERAVVLAVRAAEGDFRDWDDIASWGAEIAGALER